MSGHDSSVYAVSFLANGRWIASGSFSIKFWDLETGLCVQTLDRHEGSVRAVANAAAHPGYLVSYSFDRTIKTWISKATSYVRTMDTKTFASSVAFSVGSQWLALGFEDSFSFDRKVRILNLALGFCFRTFYGQTRCAPWRSRRTVDCSLYPVNTVPFSGDGQRLITGSFDRTIQIWQFVKSPRSRRSQSANESRRRHVFGVTLHSTIREG